VTWVRSVKDAASQKDEREKAMRDRLRKLQVAGPTTRAAVSSSFFFSSSSSSSTSTLTPGRASEERSNNVCRAHHHPWRHLRPHVRSAAALLKSCVCISFALQVCQRGTRANRKLLMCSGACK
jgi:hypothetical protein